MAAPPLEPGDLQGFSALHCRDRWLALQRLRAAVGADAVLLVLGPDAQFSRGSEVCFNWLLGGLWGRDLLAAPLEGRHEEVVVCIQGHRSTVFCRRAQQEEMITKTALWESCEVIVPTKEEEADQDAYDSRKTWAFIGMVSSCRSLAVALRAEDEQGDGKMAVERWPLVQAYGYDEFGFGFLTLHKAVVNLEQALQLQAYPVWDVPALLGAQAHVAQLRRAWDEAMLVHDRRATGQLGGAGSLENVVGASIVDYFEYGRIALSDGDVREMRGEPPLSAGDPRALLDPAPRVLVGAAQSKHICGGVPGEALSDAAAAVGPPESQPLHMIWEAVEPVTGMAATRTYALGADALLRGQAAAPSPLPTLLRAYAAAAGCCRHVLAAGGGGPLAEALGAADERRRAEVLREAAAAFLATCGGVTGTLHLYCSAMDAAGLPANAGLTGAVSLLFVRVALVDVVCPLSGVVCGTVAFGDSAFCARPCADAPLLGFASQLATAAVPTFALWPAASDNPASAEVRAGLDAALGVGFDRGPSVALGHRGGVRVYLEDKGPPPDPLGLGPPVDLEARSALACCLAGPPHAPLLPAGHGAGTAWAFASGKVVVWTPRTGHLLLIVRPGPHGLPSTEASNGLVWVPAQPVGPSDGALRVAVAVAPSTAAALRAVPAADADPDDLRWTAAGDLLGQQQPPDSGVGVGVAGGELVRTAALAQAHGGPLAAEACALFFGDEGGEAVDQPCACVWVSGLPGCGALDVAAALGSSLRAPVVDLGAVAGADAAEDIAAFAAPLAEAIRAHMSQGCSTVVVCDTTWSPAEVLERLATTPPFAHTCAVRHVLSVVEPRVAYPWHGLRHPLLLSRTLRSWVSAVAVQDNRQPAGAPAQLPGRDWDALAALCARELSAGRGSNEAVLPRPSTNTLVTGPLQRPPASRAARALALPPASAPAGRPHARLRCAFVPTSGPLDPAALRAAALDRLRAAADASAAAGGASAAARGPAAAASAAVWRGLFCVEAHVLGATPSTWEGLAPEQLLPALQGAGAVAACQMVLTSSGDLPPPQHRPAPLGTAYGVLWWWCVPCDEVPGELQQRRLEEAVAAVRACGLRPPAPRQQWTVADVPPEQVAEIARELHAEGLPPGFYFAGTHYMDADGRAHREHPALPARLEALVAAHNAAVDAWAAAAQQAALLPMFQPPA